MTARILCLCLISAAVLFVFEGSAVAGSRNEMPNEVNLELAGKCLLYSFSYQRMLAEPIGLEAGVSMFGGSGSGSSTTVTFFTVGTKVYFLQKNASPYIGAGFVVLSATTSSGPFSDSGSGNYGYITPGFEFRSEGGFLIRGGVYMLFNSGGSFVWPGITVGVAF